MRKTFKLNVEGKNRDRLMDASKHDIRKYVKRERRVPLPEGVHFWDFDCKFGSSEETAEPTHLSALTGLMDTAAGEGAEQFYVEIVAKPGYRQARPEGSKPPAADEADADFGDDDLN